MRRRSYGVASIKPRPLDHSAAGALNLQHRRRGGNLHFVNGGRSFRLLNPRGAIPCRATASVRI